MSQQMQNEVDDDTDPLEQLAEVAQELRIHTQRLRDKWGKDVPETAELANEMLDTVLSLACDLADHAVDAIAEQRQDLADVLDGEDLEDGPDDEEDDGHDFPSQLTAGDANLLLSVLEPMRSMIKEGIAAAPESSEAKRHLAQLEQRVQNAIVRVRDITLTDEEDTEPEEIKSNNSAPRDESKAP